MYDVAFHVVWSAFDFESGLMHFIEADIFRCEFLMSPSTTHSD